MHTTIITEPVDKGDSFSSLIKISSSTEKPQKVFHGYNLGNGTFLMSVPMKDFYSMSKVANERQPDGTAATQRPLNAQHATKLASYILKGLISAAIQQRKIQNLPKSNVLEGLLLEMGSGAYLSLQPIVANIRTCGTNGKDLRAKSLETAVGETIAFQVFLKQQDLLYIIDGQHRRFAMDMVFQFLDEVRQKRLYPRKLKLFTTTNKVELSTDVLAAWDECDEVARRFCTVAVEVHLGLDATQERQLFHDLNNLGKSVDKNLALRFDSANSINSFIQNELVSGIFGWSDVVDKDVKDWHADTGIWTFKDLAAVNSILFLNKTNINSATPANIEPKKELAKRFWQAVQSIPDFGEEKAKTKTVAAQPVVVKALAKLAYDFAYGRQRDDSAEEHLELLLDKIPAIDFSHSNKCWRYYEMNDDQRRQNGIESLRQYLPKDDGSNRDIGGYNESMGWMRFGAKHNDIYPIIGDIIRWQLRLPSRHR